MNNNINSEYRTVQGYEIANQQENKLTPAMEDYLEMAVAPLRLTAYNC